jgi:hypothetical protein
VVWLWCGYGVTKAVASSGYRRQRARRRDANEEYKNGKHKEVIRERLI